MLSGDTGEEKRDRSKDILLIVHADDLGMCHSVNTAIFETITASVVTSASVMVPCPWFHEVVEWAKQRPSVDLGVHLTLTSEWTGYRWRPMVTGAPVGLVDESGYLRQSPVFLRSSPLAAVESEIREQLRMFATAGLTPSHIDSHMFALFYRQDLVNLYLRLALEHDIGAFIPFEMRVSGSATPKRRLPRSVDFTFQAPPCLAASQWTSFYLDTLHSLKPGVNQLTVHPGRDGEELRAATSEDGDWGSRWRQRDHDFLMSAQFQQALEDKNIKLVCWKDFDKVDLPVLGIT